MNRLYITALLVSVLCYSALAQQPQRVSHKLGLTLYNEAKVGQYLKHKTQKALLVKGDPGTVQALTIKYKGTFKYSAGDISSVTIPIENVLPFSNETGVVRIDGGGVRGFAFMDTARIANNIDSAHLGIAPLAQPYKGDGVIVGIIDGGIYFRHQDFRRANGNTRILYLWDQYLSAAASPSPYNYGSEWDSTAINNGLCTASDPANDQGHGTNVAGIAAGNGLSWPTGPLAGRYTGTAPNADMIVVNINDTMNFLQAVTDAVNYIFTKASQLGRPCVINTSVGTYYGSHDGQDLAGQAIDAMLDAQKGRVLVASAGNAGGLKYHLAYTLSATDSLFTWFSYNTTYHQLYFDLWADTTQFKQASFALGCDNTIPAFLGRTKYYNVITDFNPAQGVTVQIADSLMQGNTKLGNYIVAVTLSGGTYHVEFLINPVATTNLWRLQTMGQGAFDLWSSAAAITGSSNIVATPPGGFTSANYRYPDSLKTVVSSWQCSDKVITVGNYSNRAAYQDSAGAYIPSNLVDGSLLANSSIGPTRDGRIKPDITATGTVTTATGDSLYIALLSHSGQGSKVSLGGKHTRNGGTSMASPIVAGTAALYLQEHPNAGYKEVKEVLQRTAKHDAFTTASIPNINWGWGKVNCYQALLYPVVYGCMDTGSVNYNAAANIDTGGCIAKVYGCTDTGAVNYNPQANVNNGTCVPKVYGITDSLCSNYNPHANVPSGVCIPLAIIETGGTVSFDVIPNPFSNTAIISIETNAPLQNAQVRFYDVLGNVADAVTIPAGVTRLTYNNSKLAAGIYTTAIISGNKTIAVKKVVVEK